MQSFCDDLGQDLQSGRREAPDAMPNKSKRNNERAMQDPRLALNQGTDSDQEKKGNLVDQVGYVAETQQRSAICIMVSSRRVAAASCYNKWIMIPRDIDKWPQSKNAKPLRSPAQLYSCNCWGYAPKPDCQEENLFEDIRSNPAQL